MLHGTNINIVQTLVQTYKEILSDKECNKQIPDNNVTMTFINIKNAEQNNISQESLH